MNSSDYTGEQHTQEKVNQITLVKKSKPGYHDKFIHNQFGTNTENNSSAAP